MHIYYSFLIIVNCNCEKVVIWKAGIHKMETYYTGFYWNLFGYMIDSQPYFAVIWSFLMIWDLTKKSSDL